MKINDDLLPIVTSISEPIGPNKKKIWFQHSHNLYSQANEMGNINDNGVNSSSDNKSRTKNYIRVEPNTQYTINITNGTTQIIAFFYGSSKTYISRDGIESSASSYTFTTPKNCYYIRFRYSGTSLFTSQLVKGSAVLSYEPFAKDNIYLLNENNNYEEIKSQSSIDYTNKIIKGLGIYQASLWPNQSNYTKSIDGLDVNPEAGGRCCLALVSGHSGTGNTTFSSLWLLRFGYNGDNIASTKVATLSGSVSDNISWGIDANKQLTFSTTVWRSGYVIVLILANNTNYYE